MMKLAYCFLGVMIATVAFAKEDKAGKRKPANTANVESCSMAPDVTLAVEKDTGASTDKSDSLVFYVSEGQNKYYFYGIVEHGNYTTEAARGLMLRETGKPSEPTALIVRRPENTIIAFHGKVLIVAGCH